MTIATRGQGFPAETAENSTNQSPGQQQLPQTQPLVPPQLPQNQQMQQIQQNTPELPTQQQPEHPQTQPPAADPSQPVPGPLRLSLAQIRDRARVQRVARQTSCSLEQQPGVCIPPSVVCIPPSVNRNRGEDYQEWLRDRYPPLPGAKTVGGTAPPLGPEAEPPNPAFNQNCNDASCSCHEVDFPYDKLQSLDEKISSPRWIVPVLPDQELECLIEAAINLCRSGQDVKSEACQRFFREGLTISFTKILTDDAVNSWKFNIQHCIYKNCERLIELIVLKLNQDWFPLLDLLAMVFNPSNKFHSFNASRSSEKVPLDSPDEEIFAKPGPDFRNARGWLIDLINKFGSLNGFQILLDRFQSRKNLTVPVIYALIRPFGLCYELLTVQTIEKYLMPIVEMIPELLNNLTDEELKKEAKNESKNDAISSIIKACKLLVSRVPGQGETGKQLEIFRLKMILRLLQISSFNGKMNALNEVNKVISSVSYYSHRHALDQGEEWLTPERMAKWIKENNVLEIVLADSMHQPQYVEKLEKILRFIIKEKALTIQDLDAIWAAQVGKHEAIVKNVHDLFAKLAWDFSSEQLDHLFERFQSSWTTANRKQREKLLELIRRLAEDDKEGVMAQKVLTLFWNLAHSEDVLTTEIMDQALSAHVKILDYNCSQERDAQKTIWLNKCVEELKANDNWVLPALKQIREICSLYEPTTNINHSQRNVFHRQEVIDKLQQEHTLVIVVTNSLTSYMDKVRKYVQQHPDTDPETFYPDKRYNHVAQVQERLNFLRFLLKDGQLWLCADQAREIWHSLAEEAVFVCDREACFKWFSKLMGEEPDLDPAVNRDFFERNILQLDPVLLTESGMKCFERFFRAVNIKEGKLKIKRRAVLMDDLDLIGTDYLWRVITTSSDGIANRAIELLKETCTNLGPKLASSVTEFHDSFIMECVDRLRTHYDTVAVLTQQVVPTDAASAALVQGETLKMSRVMKVLQEYICECDSEFHDERKIVPLFRAHRGKPITLVIRFIHPVRQGDDMEMLTHTNETIGSIKRQIIRKIKLTSNIKLELFINGDLMMDKKVLGQMAVRDKTFITVKLMQISPNVQSSPESSSDSSTSSPQHPYNGPNVDAESNLPGVMMAQNHKNAEFFFHIADKGSELNDFHLRESARAVLKIIPPDTTTVERLQALFSSASNLADGQLPAVTTNNSLPPPTIENMFYCDSPSEVLYNLEVLYSLIMPAVDPISDRAFEFQFNFLRSKDSARFLDMLATNILPNSDSSTMRSAYLMVLKICKLLLTIIGHIMHLAMDESQPVPGLVSAANAMPEEPLAPDPASPCPTNSSPLPAQCSDGLHRRTPLFMLKQAIVNFQSHSIEYNIARKLAHCYKDQICSVSNGEQPVHPLIVQALEWSLPNKDIIAAIIQMAWASASGGSISHIVSYTQLHQQLIRNKQSSQEHVLVAKEALELLTIALILNPSLMESLTKEKMWHTFIVDIVLICNNRLIRMAAAEQLILMLTFCCSQQPLQHCITSLFSVLNTLVVEHAHNSHEYFELLCRLLNLAFSWNCPIMNLDATLVDEVLWLKKMKERLREVGEGHVEEALIEGHLGITKELVSFMPPERKFQLGSDESEGINLIKELVEDFIFPASRMFVTMRKSGELPEEQPVAVCSTPATLSSGFDLLVALCTGCVQNMRLLVAMLTEYFYSEHDEPLTEWDYLPPVGPRPPRGFVGLKNAGATCYMNSVIQQLYMVPSIRSGILAAEGAVTDPNEDFSGDDSENLILDNQEFDDKCNLEDSRKEYNIGILKQVQAIFGHLACSKLQYYVPRGLWRHFKLQGEPVNLREQQDAVEFFMSLVESIDEALKALNQEQIMSKILGGSYSDQKICKECPHRYAKEEPFSVISVDIRNHSNLLDSMEQYVKGELLEGADSYHCDKCDKKVVTVKRLCVKKLPPVLAIQLKRFEYDFDRVCAIKFNDYFEFPRNFDMEPYTVSGLAKVEGELIDCESPSGNNNETLEVCTKYHLTGIVVHSGQASGGHYFSYILHRTGNTSKWYKFDDGEVSECKMEDDEEMKNLCYGGDYMGEVFDQILKRMSLRRQKRWWNAYMLFYTRADATTDADVDQINLVNNIKNLVLSNPSSSSLVPSAPEPLKMPSAIEKSVRRQNVKFMHTRNQFSLEYFQFIRYLTSANTPSNPHIQRHLQLSGDRIAQHAEELSLLSVQIASRFLFYTGFHTKKSLRGTALDWHDAFCYHLKTYSSVRYWFCQNVLFSHTRRFAEYLLTCPNTEVRSAFMKIIVFLAHFSLNDGPCPNSQTSLSDHLILAVLSLLQKEVSEYGRYLPNYFTLFHNYASLGIPERTQLLKLNVPAMFMLVALDEGPNPAVKYNNTELTKLHMVVSQLIRCCDVSSKCSSPLRQDGPLPNPYKDPACIDYIMPIQPEAADILYGRSSYVKKIIEDSQLTDESIKLLQFCCWENPHFSRTVLSEILWQIAFAYCQDLKHHIDLLLGMLLMEDTWQERRIHNALRGVPDDREGLFDTIQRSKSHYQKRAYQCIKCLVTLFTRCPLAHNFLQTNAELKRKWILATEWLQEELDKRPFANSTPYIYPPLSPTQSNDFANGYFLERSNSARKTLERACDLCPDTETEPDIEAEADETSEEGESSQPDDCGRRMSFPLARTEKQGDKEAAMMEALNLNKTDTSPHSLHSDSMLLIQYLRNPEQNKQGVTENPENEGS
ncbi:unnamed protein product [Bemisia tabaci]|uniref:Ubiquitinyl hydrolase 1 n=1 Tax=Bemisia tabaci TaxID=7038 RepID=A0A9P0A9I3_BEMTA|nr:unnamed protein product [Bemisia tabaci]